MTQMTQMIRRARMRPIFLAAPATAALACVLLATVAAAQTYGRTVPRSVALQDGADIEPFLLGGYDGRTQVLIAARALRGFAGKSIRRIIVRRDVQTAGSFPNGMKGGWIDLMVLASWTSRSERNPSAVFAQNHGKTPIVVYRGGYRVPDSVSLPAGTKAASLAPNVSAHIVLQSSIAYVPNKNLCLEFVHRQHASKAGPGRWLADLELRPGASKTTFGRSCFRPGKVDASANRFDGATVVGGSLMFATRAPVTPLALLVIGASNVRWGANKLPFDFGTMGAKNCYLFVSLDMLFPMGVRKPRNGSAPRARVELPVPYSVGLVGSRIYSEWFFFQPGANSLSMTTTNGASVRIAAAPGLESSLIESLDVASAIGRVSPERSLALHLEGK